MKYCRMVIVLVGVVVFAGVASAALVSLNSEAVSASSGGGAAISAFGASEVVASIEGHSEFTVTMTATNQSGMTWTGYTLTLDPSEQASFVEGIAGSTRFKTVTYPNAWTITFLAPDAVPQGGVVTLWFDISIPEPGPYTFTLTQKPIPEPATVLFVGFGALALMSARRR